MVSLGALRIKELRGVSRVELEIPKALVWAGAARLHPPQCRLVWGDGPLGLPFTGVGGLQVAVGIHLQGWG